MKTEIYSCDKCGEKVEGRKMLVEVKIETEPYSSFSNRQKFYWCKELCLECCKKIGITWEKPNPVPQGKTPTTGDRLYEIVQDIIRETV